MSTSRPGAFVPLPAVRSLRVPLLEMDRDWASEQCDVIDPVGGGSSGVDPVQAAVDLLLDRATRTARIRRTRLGGGGTVCLALVPSTEWIGAVREAWRRRFRGLMPPTTDLILRDDPAEWLCVYPEDGQFEVAFTADEAMQFARAVSGGVHALGIATTERCLPIELRLAADHRLTLTGPTTADIREIIRATTGRRSRVAIPQHLAGSIGPNVLRLSRRPDQTASAYASRLVEMARQARDGAVGSDAGESPREAPILDRLHGMAPAVDWGRALSKDLDACRAGHLRWSDIDRGCLLSGGPGCGKSLFARALARTCGVPLICGSYGDWIGTGTGHQGNLLIAMRATFEKARASAPCILFLDEVDSFPDRSRLTGTNAQWTTQVVNALLTELDGSRSREGVIVIGATNNPQNVDPALCRSGRLDRHVAIGSPSVEDLELILREHLGHDLSGPSLAPAALRAAGSSGADCERYVRGARRTARFADRPMEMTDLIAEISGADSRTPDEIRRCAIHEAGHAVAAAILFPGQLTAVSLRHRGGKTSMRRSVACPGAADLHRDVTLTLAGRAAEEVVTGIATAGAGGSEHSDLGQATVAVARGALSCGFGDLGLVWHGNPTPEDLRHHLMRTPAAFEEIRRRLDHAYADARDLVAKHREHVLAVADALVARFAISGEEVEAIVTRRRTAHAAVPP